MKSNSLLEHFVGLFAVVGAIISPVAFGESVYANNSKINATGVTRCYMDSSAVVQTISFNKFDEYSDVIVGSNNQFVPLTTTNPGGNYESCQSLIRSLLNAKSGIKSNYSMSEIDGRRELLEMLGYVADVPKESRCVVFNVNKKSYSSASPSSASQNAKLCSVDGTAGGIAVDKNLDGKIYNSDAIQFSVNSFNNTITVKVSGKRTDSGSLHEKTFPLSGSLTVLADNIRVFVSENIGNCLDTSFCLDPEKPIEIVSGDVSANTTYVLSGDRSVVGKQVAERLVGTSDLAFTPAEKYNLYYGYLKDYYAISNPPVCDYSDASAKNYESQGYKLGTFKVDGEIKKCYVRATKNYDPDKKVNALSGDLFVGARKTWEELLGEIDAIEAHLKDDDNVTDVSGTGGEENELCYNAGVDGISWIICPAINNLAKTADGVDTTINMLLSVDPNDYGYGSKAEEVWNKTRDIANVILILILVVIIISQITGFGIDNYGIKKMLPKLIVMAILINLSFVLCVLAVDLSNIFGESLNELFGGIGVSIAGGEQNNVVGFFGTMVTLAFAAAGAVSVVAGPLAAMSAIVLFLALVAVVFGILLFFFSLGARMMLVVLCVAMSPIAFACYILPNTQIIFKKWWDIFKAALLLFPICGALSGISRIIREIGNSSDNIMMMVIAMIAVVIPYYALPILLKNSLSGLSSIGAAVSSFGSSVRKGVERGSDLVRGSESYKEAQSEIARNRQAASAQRTIDRLENRIRNSGGNRNVLTAREQRQLARASEIQRKLNEENEVARTKNVEREYERSSEADLQNAWIAARNAGNAEELAALTNVLSSRYGTTAAGWIGSQLANRNSFDNQGGWVSPEEERSFNALQDVLRRNTSFAGNMKNKASDAFQMLSSGGNINGVRRNINGPDGHAAGNRVMTEDKDFATQSAETLRRAAIAGSLDQERALSLLNSEDSAIRSGIASDRDKRMVLEAVANGYHGNFRDQDFVDAYNNYRTQAQNRANATDQRRRQMEDDIHTISDRISHPWGSGPIGA